MYVPSTLFLINTDTIWLLANTTSINLAVQAQLSISGVHFVILLTVFHITLKKI